MTVLSSHWVLMIVLLVLLLLQSRELLVLVVLTTAKTSNLKHQPYDAHFGKLYFSMSLGATNEPISRPRGQII